MHIRYLQKICNFDSPSYLSGKAVTGGALQGGIAMLKNLQYNN